MVHWTITRFLIFMLVKKQSIQGLNSLSYFHAHEKMTHTVIALFAFLERKLKRPVRVFLLIFVYEW